MNRFDDKVVLVTGAGSGFGRAIAMRMSSEGAQVMVADLARENGESVVEEITNAGGNAAFQTVDVSRADQVEKMVEACIETYGRLDVLVNNAGYSHQAAAMWKLTEEQFVGVFEVNVKGVFLGCKYAIPKMIDQGGGAIVNTASIAAVSPRPGLTPYNASKGAVLTMTRGLALETARHNIRVNCVNPVASDTDFMKGAMGVQDRLSEDQVETFIKTIPRGRLLEPDDVAAAVCFLASDDADMITGTALNVDGGRSV